MLCKNKCTRQVYCIHCSTIHSTVYYWVPNLYTVGFPGDLVLKNPPADAGDMGSIPVSGRSSGEGNDNPSWYSCLGNPMNRRTSWATVNGFAKDWTRLSDERRVKSESDVAQSCPTLCNPMDCSLPGFSVHGIFQARVLQWVAISFSRSNKSNNSLCVGSQRLKNDSFPQELRTWKRIFVSKNK